MGLANRALCLLFLSAAAAAAPDCSAPGPAAQLARHEARLRIDWCGKDYATDGDMDELASAFVRAYDEVGAAYEAEHCFSFDGVTVEKVPRRRALEDKKATAVDKATAADRATPKARALDPSIPLLNSPPPTTSPPTPKPTSSPLFAIWDFSLYYQIIFQCLYCNDPERDFADDGFRFLMDRGQGEGDAGASKPTKGELVEKMNQILAQKGMCVSSLESEGVSTVKASNSSSNVGPSGMVGAWIAGSLAAVALF